MRRFDEWVLSIRILGPLSTRYQLIIIENGVTLTRVGNVVNSDGGLSLASGHCGKLVIVCFEPQGGKNA